MSAPSSLVIRPTLLSYSSLPLSLSLSCAHTHLNSECARKSTFSIRAVEIKYNTICRDFVSPHRLQRRENRNVHRRGRSARTGLRVQNDRGIKNVPKMQEMSVPSAMRLSRSNRPRPTRHHASEKRCLCGRAKKTRTLSNPLLPLWRQFGPLLASNEKASPSTGEAQRSRRGK